MKPLPFRIKPGDIFEDCSYHPVLCTEAVREFGNDYDIIGVSLFTGAMTSCSLKHCVIRKMSPTHLAVRIKNRDRWLAAEAQFRESEWRNMSDYDMLFREENEMMDSGLLNE